MIVCVLWWLAGYVIVRLCGCVGGRLCVHSCGAVVCVGVSVGFVVRVVCV